MVDYIDLSIDWKKGTVKQALAKLPETFDFTAEQSLEEAAEFMKQMAKNLVHVDTGALQTSIRKERGGEGAHWHQITVRAGGYITNPKTGKLVNYAHWVEMKYPYMRPAYEMTAPFLHNLIRQKILESV